MVKDSLDDTDGISSVRWLGSTVVYFLDTLSNDFWFDDDFGKWCLTSRRLRSSEKWLTSEISSVKRLSSEGSLSENPSLLWISSLWGFSFCWFLGVMGLRGSIIFWLWVMSIARIRTKKPPKRTTKLMIVSWQRKWDEVISITTKNSKF